MENTLAKRIIEPETISDTRRFAELYAKLPQEKKEVIIAYMAGMEAQEHLSAETATRDCRAI